MRAYLAGASVGAAISFGMFGDNCFAVLAFSLAVSALAFILIKEVDEQD